MLASRVDWRTRAACRRTLREMVPDDDQRYVSISKKICAECPVVSHCLAYAEQLVATYGRSYAQGVWGGLTLQERDTLAVLGRPPRPCPRCRLICVPVSYATELCQQCAPKSRLAYDDYRDQITALIASGLTYQQVADRLRLKRSAVFNACLRWRIKAKVAAGNGRRAVKECGTLAAKTRHSRHGESWQNCACKHVAWKKGRPRASAPDMVNVS
jgi:hypothetical protein